MKQFLFLFGLLLLLAACALNSDKETAVSLDGTSWILSDFEGVTLIPGVDVTAEFADGQISGTSGCNSYGGAYTLDGNNFSIGEIASTAMDCLDPIMALETPFQEALLTATAVSLNEDTLTIETEMGTLTFVPQTAVSRQEPIAPTQLFESIWQLVALETPDGPLPAQSEAPITMQFTPDIIAGHSGCIRYTAGYHLAPEAFLLLVGNFSQSARDCRSGAGQLEQTFFNLLETAESYTLEADTLTIFTTNGTLAFTPMGYTDYAPHFVALPDGTTCSLTTTDDPVTVDGQQRRYYCNQSGQEQTALIGELQPQENGWQTEMALLRGNDDNFEIVRTESVTVTLPAYGPGDR